MAVNKKKTKMSRRTKKTIRRSVSALCMASAILVALVPPKPTEAYIQPTETTYEYGVETTDETAYSAKGDKLYSDGVNLKLYADKTISDTSTGTIYAGEPDVYKILKVSQLSDGTYTVNWQFKVYLQNVSQVAMGVICEYNSTYAAGVVTITPSMPYEYIVIEPSEYNAFFDAYLDAKNNGSDTVTVSGRTLDSSYSISKVETTYDSTSDQYWIEKYFPTEYATYVTKYEQFKAYQDYQKYVAYVQYLADKEAYTAAYNTYLTEHATWASLHAQYESDYNTWLANGSVGPAPVEPVEPIAPVEPTPVEYVAEVPAVSPVADPGTLKVWVYDMTNEYKAKYFCDVHPDYNNTSIELKGYHLVEVADYRSGSSSVNMPKVYMPMGEPNPYSSTSTESFAKSTNKNDELGFRILNKCLVIAIGEDAFRNTTNVDQLDICKEIKYIGDNAFRDSFVQSVTFQNIKNIGNRAFKNCSRLDTITLKDGAVNIGTEAFYGCKFTKLLFPYSIEYIGPGAFANCTKLTELDLSQINRDCEIDNFAFFDAIALNKLDFSDTIYRVGEAAFACVKGISGGLTEVTLPDHITGTYEGKPGIGNFVFAGRTNLQNVHMPADYGKNNEVELPYGVFFNCTGLKCVEFPDVGGSCGYVKFGVYKNGETTRNIFDTILQSDFYVRGPEKNIIGEIAYPRRSTWGQKSGLDLDVPYVYIDTNGEEQFEISDGKYILIVDDYGVLQSCILAAQGAELRQVLQEGIELTIPSKVGDTKVTGIAEACFADEDLHDNITKLIIEDNSISEIAEAAFKNCKRLEYVSIGNSVNKIGASAFEGCSKLVYVNFETPASGYASFPVENIGSNAFSTGADKLTFEGDIDEGYGPFVWAMDVNNFVSENEGIRVCYTTGYPTYLTVILDNCNELPTLIDYPHYEQIDALSGTDKGAEDERLSFRYEHLGEEYEYDVSGNNYVGVYSINLNEERLVNSALNLNVPSGIKSIDVKGYLNNSTGPADSISLKTNTNNAYKYLLSNEYYNTYKNYGLFNGYYGRVKDMYGDLRELAASNTNEKEAIGNDRLRSITLNSVEYLPDRCFNSCEQLRSAFISTATEDMGAAPFSGCYNLTGLAVSNPNYVCQNGILYKVNEDGTYTLTEVLGSRGVLVGTPKLKVSDEDPYLSNVTDIGVGAMENCDGLTGVDLTGLDRIKELPDECFRDSNKLSQIIVPNNITSVGHECFADSMEGTQIVFYGEEVFLPADAFKGLESFKVVSYEDSAVRKAARDLGADVTDILNYTYKVIFVDYDGTELSDVIYVVDGSNVSLDYVPENPTRVGYIFNGWNRNFENITEDTFIVATYIPDPDYVDPDAPTPTPPEPTQDPNGGGGGGGNGSGIGDGSGDDGDDITNGTGALIGTGTKKKTTGKNSGKKSGGSEENPTGTPSETPSGTPTATPNATTEPTTTPTAFYTLTVNNGNGSGSYAAGATVIITCTNIPAGKYFAKWIGDTDDLGIASVSVAATTMVMPAHDAAVTATFSDAPVNNSSTGTAGDGSGNNSQGTTQDGSQVIISKPGISNTALASASVTGSPDDYVIRINETQAATEAVERALINKYGSLDNVKYSAMDITLYDSTGTTLITDYTGLSVNITLPIPDVLAPYAGNNKAASVVNEQLEPVDYKFVSIDGVPCITITATHFSPYTIYVDVQNLSDSSMDATPKTGDGIAPKWFLSFGLAALGIALWFMKDKKVMGV